MAKQAEGTAAVAPLIAVAVVNHNGGEMLSRCLRALAAQTWRDFEAIVADNGSTDGSFAAARATLSDSRFRFVDFGANLGFAAANNRAAAMARGTWLATLNPDAFPEPGWLAALQAATLRYPRTAMFGSTQLDAADPRRLDGAGDALAAIGIPWRGGHGARRPASAPEAGTFSPCAAAALYRLDRFRAAGGFDESFFCYCEDVDLAFRLRLLGDHCIQVPDAVVHHVGGASSAGRPGFAVRQGARNRLWSFVKNMPAPLFWPLLPAHLAASLLLAIAAGLRGQGGAFLGGWAAGIRDLPRVWRQRRRVQAARRATAGAIAAALCWSPATVLSRRPHRLRPGR